MEVASDSTYDVLVVGGGPAGLSAALVLGRCRRAVLVVDAGNQRNIASDELHGFLTRDGTRPSEFLSLARQEVGRYGVQIADGTVQAVEGSDGRFASRIGDRLVYSKKVLLATGVVDRVPQIRGIQDFYGRSVHHCPYCDAWEHQDGRIAVYGRDKVAAIMAIKLRGWTEDVVICTDGTSKIPEPQRERLVRHGVRVYEQPIARLDGVPPKLAQVVFEDGSAIDRSALFFATGNSQRSELIAQLGVKLSGKGRVKISRGQRTSVSGVFVCGDAAEDSQFVVVAASHGARAAMAINTDLFESDFA